MFLIYKKMKNKLLIFTFFILILIRPTSVTKAASEIKAFSVPLNTPAAIIDAINAYRKQSGSPAMKTDSTLMLLAQTQSDYQASIGSVTHTGPGGTRPIDRAYAAGYGGGNKLFFSEIIYGGTNATVDTAMNWWKNSSLHNRVMLDSQYYEIGAGLSTDGSFTYFTAELGNITGVSAPANAGTPAPSDSTDADSSEELQEYGIVAVPVVKATLEEDGSLVHIVRSGQALWTIAAVYEVDMQTLIDLNGFSQNPLLHPGDEILIHPVGSFLGSETPDAPSDQTGSAASSEGVIGEAVSQGGPSNQSSGTSTPLPTVIQPAVAEGAGTESPTGLSPTVRWIVILAFSSLFLVMVGSIFLQTRPERPQDDDPVR